MMSVIGILFFFSFVVLIVGLIKPSIVIRWGEEEKKTRKSVMGVFMSIFVATIILGMFTTEPSNKNQDKNAEQQLSQDEKREDREITDIEKIAKKATSNADFKDVKIIKIENGEMYNVDLLLTGEESLTTKMTYRKYKNSCKDVFQALYTSKFGTKINEVKVSIYAEFVNKQTGEESEKVAYSLTMDRERAAKMHWDNIGEVDIEMATKNVYLHPAIKKEVKK